MSMSEIITALITFNSTELNGNVIDAPENVIKSFELINAKTRKDQPFNKLIIQPIRAHEECHTMNHPS